MVTLTAHEIHDILTQKKSSCVEVTQIYIDRIADVDGVVGSYLAQTPEAALQQAAKVDAKIQNGASLSPLEGVPAALKDNLCTVGVPTTCSSRMLENFVPPYNAHVVDKLEAQGTPILGKLNMDEFAMGSSTETSYFKQTKNPHDITRVPGGSSGGSAAAVAAGLCAFALGSDTGGSIRQPASYCGVVGLKPTYSRVSRRGCVAFASSLDQIGSLTRDVRDAALVFSAIAGHDPLDTTSLDVPVPDVAAALSEDVRGFKFGFAADYLGDGVQDDVREAVLRAGEIFRALGGETCEVTMQAAAHAVPAYYIISSAEASANLARFDGVRYGYRSPDARTLHELYEKSRSEGFGTEVKRRILIGTYALSSGYYDAYYNKAQKVRTIISEDFKRKFEEVDLIVTPTAMTTAFPFGARSNPVEMYLNDLCTVSVNIAGLPAISVPCGLDKQGLPIGLQLIAPPLGEEKLLRAAYAFEQAFGYRALLGKGEHGYAV